jgi:Isoprenylcysteine carboxyl methyltransferase (ICMT) family.
MWLLPILAFGYSLVISREVFVIDWLCLAIAFIGTLLVIKGKRDLGSWHTWAGTWLPGAPRVKDGIFRWLPHPMYTGIILTIISCSLIYITRLPGLVSLLALLCCLYIVSFLVIVAFREQRHFLQI